jgi:hypothetical protein
MTVNVSILQWFQEREWRRQKEKRNEKIKMTKMKMAFCALPSWRLAVSRGLYMPGKAVSTAVGAKS